MPLGRLPAVSGAYAARLPIRLLGLPQQDGGMFFLFQFRVRFCACITKEVWMQGTRPSRRAPLNNTAPRRANIKKIGSRRSQSQYPSGVIELNEIEFYYPECICR